MQGSTDGIIDEGTHRTMTCAVLRRIYVHPTLFSDIWQRSFFFHLITPTWLLCLYRSNVESHNYYE
jgi:hypothetical protein